MNSDMGAGGDSKGSDTWRSTPCDHSLEAAAWEDRNGRKTILCGFWHLSGWQKHVLDGSDHVPIRFGVIGLSYATPVAVIAFIGVSRQNIEFH